MLIGVEGSECGPVSGWIRWLSERLPGLWVGLLGAPVWARLPSMLAGETLIDRVPAAAHPMDGSVPPGPAPSERDMEPASGS